MGDDEAAMGEETPFQEEGEDLLAYLTTTGVKNGSRMMIEVNLMARAKRLLEMRFAALVERVAKSLTAITVAIDGLPGTASGRWTLDWKQT
ncbi:hypothetical protein KSP40_PGU000545 [Platanthera guangdongensis]|uniref:Uncharacterized protein n=1 Tax=Platanthera guangdongensis TaxID=2320717 RepID=A0ABR2N4V2_9ASPA